MFIRIKSTTGAAKTVQRKGKDGGDFGANYKIIPISSKYILLNYSYSMSFSK
jgi:hypothetical protein